MPRQQTPSFRSLTLAMGVWMLAACAAGAFELRGFVPPLGTARRAAQTSTAPHPAVGRVIVPEANGTAYGSGTLVDAREQFGLVVTNWHVVRDAAGPIEIVFPSGFRSQARLLKTDEDWDLAALVVWKPPVTPAQISSAPPQPGDQLTICGYGQGDYRAATGRCTDYYAPKQGMPLELVELNVEARQGDSGGPILNAQGELAGVLFGAGEGTTLGSYGGRVNKFLASLGPGIGQPQDAPAVGAPKPILGSPVTVSSLAQLEAGEAGEPVASAAPFDAHTVLPGPIESGGSVSSRAQPLAENRVPPPQPESQVPPWTPDPPADPQVEAQLATGGGWRQSADPHEKIVAQTKAETHDPLDKPNAATLNPVEEIAEQAAPNTSGTAVVNAEEPPATDGFDWLTEARNVLALVGLGVILLHGVRAVT